MIDPWDEEFLDLDEIEEPSVEELRQIEAMEHLLGYDVFEQVSAISSRFQCPYCREVWILPGSQNISEQVFTGCLDCLVEGNTLSTEQRALFALPNGALFRDVDNSIWVKLSRTAWVLLNGKPSSTAPPALAKYLN